MVDSPTFSLKGFIILRLRVDYPTNLVKGFIILWVCINLAERKNIESAFNTASAHTIHV
jgi:hypothetical protein